MKKIVLWLLAAGWLAGCAPQLPPQSEDQAIAVANLFLRDLAQGQYRHAFDAYLAEESRRATGLDPDAFAQEFEAILAAEGRITRALFDAYQAVPGRNELQLYYRVFHETSGEVPYHFVLAGRAGAEYKILLVDRGDHLPYPPDLELHPEAKRLKKTGVVEVQLY